MGPTVNSVTVLVIDLPFAHLAVPGAGMSVAGKGRSLIEKLIF